MILSVECTCTILLVCVILYSALKKNEGAIKNGQSRDTCKLPVTLDTQDTGRRQTKQQQKI